MTSLDRLLTAIRAVAPGADVSVGRWGDSSTVRVHPTEMQAAAQAAIDAYDWSPEMDAAWELTVTRTAALTGLLTRSDEIGIGVRAVTRAIVTLVNDRLESLGQPRITELEILAFIRAVPQIGDPVPP